MESEFLKIIHFCENNSRSTTLIGHPLMFGITNAMANIWATCRKKVRSALVFNRKIFHLNRNILCSQVLQLLAVQRELLKVELFRLHFALFSTQKCAPFGATAHQPHKGVWCSYLKKSYQTLTQEQWVLSAILFQTKLPNFRSQGRPQK